MSIYMRKVTPEHERLREQVALANGFQLFVTYSEKEVAAFLKRDYTTLKRWRRGGMFDDKFPFKEGEDGVKYFGVYIADLIIWGTGKWPDEPSSSETHGSGSGAAAQTGIAAGEIPAPPAPAANPSARRILRRQSNG